MLIACWSTKGGVGTTVVAAALSLLLARRSSLGAVVVDLAGDVPTALGFDAVAHAPGVADWLARAPDVPPDALVRLELRAGPGLAVIPRGDGLLRAGPEVDALAALLVDEPRPVVADCGRIDSCSPSGAHAGADADVALALAAGATRSLLVVRSSVLGLCRAGDAPVQPSGVVLVHDHGRGVSVRDVERLVDAPVLCRVRVTESVARAVDAGLRNGHLPRTLAKDLRHAVV